MIIEKCVKAYHDLNTLHRNAENQGRTAAAGYDDGFYAGECEAYEQAISLIEPIIESDKPKDTAASKPAAPPVMTGFNTQAGGGVYRIQFETTHRALYLKVQEACRNAVDWAADAEDAS